jgi:hypothetical protein
MVVGSFYRNSIPGLRVLRLVIEAAQFLAPINELMINQRLLLAVGIAGQARRFPIANLLLPEVRSLG